MICAIHNLFSQITDPVQLWKAGELKIFKNSFVYDNGGCENIILLKILL